MARKVTTGPAAARALKRAKRWLCQPGSGKEGKRRWDALRNSRRALTLSPYLGLESLEVPGHRLLVISGYRLIYQVYPDTGDSKTVGDIRIVAVFGPGEP
jgi:plasmid stabilization system protein ParE